MEKVAIKAMTMDTKTLAVGQDVYGRSYTQYFEAKVVKVTSSGVLGQPTGNCRAVSVSFWDEISNCRQFDYSAASGFLGRRTGVESSHI
jgi:hypothetical protein